MKKKFEYKEQYGLVILCDGEEEQKNLFNRLKKEGFKLKVVVV